MSLPKTMALATFAGQKHVRVMNSTLQFFTRKAPDDTFWSGPNEIVYFSYTFSNPKLLLDMRAISDERNKPYRSNQDLALLGDRKASSILTDQWFESGVPRKEVHHELVQYGVITNNYLAYVAEQTRLIENCMHINGWAVDPNNLDFHMKGTCVEAVIGAVWADSKSEDKVNEVMWQFGIYFPSKQTEEVALRQYIWRLRSAMSIGVGSTPDIKEMAVWGGCVSGNTWLGYQ